MLSNLIPLVDNLRIPSLKQNAVHVYSRVLFLNIQSLTKIHRLMFQITGHGVWDIDTDLDTRNICNNYTGACQVARHCREQDRLHLDVVSIQSNRDTFNRSSASV